MTYAEPGTLVERLVNRGWTTTPRGCWEVNGHRVGWGYSYLRFNGKRMGVHQWSHIAWVGPIPEGHVVRHKCDNPPCMNPEHLETGTNGENRQDSVSRGRTPRGELHWNAQLTNQDVLDIKTEYAKGVLTHQMLADVYGVSRVAITKRLRKEK